MSSLNTKTSRQLGDVDEPYEDATVDATVVLTRSPVTIGWIAKESDSTVCSVDTTTAGMSFTATSTAPKVTAYLSDLTADKSYTIYFLCKTSGTNSAKDNVTYAIAEKVGGEALASGSTIDGLTETTFTTTIEDITFTAACLTLDFTLTEANETITISNFVVIPQ